jgi:hypothetical protein
MDTVKWQAKAYSVAFWITERLPPRLISRGEEDVLRHAIAAKIVSELGGFAEKTVHVTRPSLEPTPLAEQTRTEWIRTLEPWARSVRERVFGGGDPPFGFQEWDEAVAWIETEMRTEVEQSGDAAAVIDSKEYRKRKRRAMADAEWLAERTGLPFCLMLAPVPPLSYERPTKTGARLSPAIRNVVDKVAAAVEEMTEEGGITVTDLARRMRVKRITVLQWVAQARKRGYLKNVEQRKGHPHRLRPGDPIPEEAQVPRGGEVATVVPQRRGGHLLILAEAAEAMVAVSGFEPAEVTAFLLTGARPSLARARVHGSFVLRWRPPTPEESAKEKRKREVGRMKLALDAALADAGVSLEEAETVLTALLDKFRESPARPSETTSDKQTRDEIRRAAVPTTGGYLVRAPKVTAEFYTSDIRHEDLRRLHGKISDTWARLRSSDPEEVVRIREEARRQAGEDTREWARTHKLPVPPPPVSRPSPRSRLTDHNRKLREIIEKLGGVPTNPSAEFWGEANRLWVEAGHKPTKHADAHRRHWERLKRKPRPTSPGGSMP